MSTGICTGLKVSAAAALAFAALSLATVAGCQKYQNYPPVAESHGLSEDPNNPATEAAIVASVQYVANRYPPGGPRYEATNSAEAGSMKVNYPIAVSVPPGMRKSFYERIPHEIGPEVVPVTPELVEQGTVPVVFVTRVQLRFHTGIVDVLRPMPELGNGPDGRPVYQKVTVRLQGGLEPWRAIHARAWEPGADEAPAYYFVPEIERVDQFKFCQMTAERQEAYDRALASHPEPVVNDAWQKTRAKKDEAVAAEKDTH